MKVRYFAWVRERVGHAEEEIDLPPDVTHVAGLIAWLAQRDEGYAARARARIASVEPLADPAVIEMPQRREQPRIPFGWLVERGEVPPGTLLFDNRKRWTAKVGADGNLIARDIRGSIHKVGAHVQGAPACNGWTFWHLERNGRDIPLDVLRQKMRAELN